MSLWTPDGEHPVSRDEPTPPGTDPSGRPSDAGYDPIDPNDIDAETAERMQEQMIQAQAQLLAAPVETVVSNHVMGLFELGALHLRTENPDLEAARLPIDAMGLLVDNLGDRLAEHETLSSALTQLRMAYVEVKNAVEGDGPDVDDVADSDAVDGDQQD